MDDATNQKGTESDARDGVQIGRPSVLSEAGPRIIAALRNGADRAAAVGYAGVPYGTVRSWISRGRSGHTPYDEFAAQVEAAEAEAAVRMAKVIFDAAHAEHDYRAALEWLKRRRPEEWGEPKAKEPEATAEASVFVFQFGDKPLREVEQLSDEELELVRRELDAIADESASD